MSKRTHGLDEREMELVKLLMADCRTTGDIPVYISRTGSQPDGCRGRCPRTPEVYPLRGFR